MKFVKFIPNLFTFLNLFFGCVAIVQGLKGDLFLLAIFILLGVVCDFFDGFFARILKVNSQLGVQLDSLSDLVTFGITPSIVMFSYLSNSDFILENSSHNLVKFVPYLSFIITIASSYRLAKFNLDNSLNHFKGLPTPANALFIVFLPFFFELEFISNYSNLLENTFFLIIIIFFFSYLLISNIEMPSFKLSLSEFFIKNKILKSLFILFSIGLLSWLSLGGLSPLILAYIVLGFLRIKL
jgi:CDP-diacylglycerol--serine O-phosphatidyltransferase